MKKVRIYAGVIVLILAFVLAGCSGSSSGTKGKLDPAYSEDLLKQSTVEVLNALNIGSFGTITENVREDLKQKLSQEVLKSAWNQTGAQLGTFKNVSAEQIIAKDQDAVVIIIGEYEKGKIELKVVYDTNMKITGFWLKTV